MKVLSLFDGISCGRVALERAGIPVETYYASEIDPHAIQITQHNYSDTIQVGDVCQLNPDDYKGIDLLIGGSPCQSLSITMGQTRTNLNGKSKLFFEYLRILKAVKPQWYLLENVASMNKESKDTITELLGVEPVLINSNCFSAQDRPRLYWTNIPVNVLDLKESSLCLKDILEPSVADKYFYSHPLTKVDLSKQVCAIMDFKNNEMHKRIFNPAFKCHTLTTCGGGNTQKKVYIDGRARKLTPIEYERLQTLPDNYTACVADSHRYSAIGNGWTVDVIAHIFKQIPTE
jgi:DNA (cytosine-5)-methyltransferase 3A